MHYSATPTAFTDAPICVIIAAYNAQKTILRAIESALAQPEVHEIIVVDDASTDQTFQEASKVEDNSQRVKIFRQPSNAGPAAARNKAISHSSAPWIAILDADDYFVDGRFHSMLTYANDADFIADNLWQIPENSLNATAKSLRENTPAHPIPVQFSDFVLSNITQADKPRQELGFIKPLMRRSFLDAHHLRYQEHMRLGEDYELYARALGLGARMLLLPSQGYISVVRENSLSGNHTEADLLHLRNCDESLASSLPLNQQCLRALQRHYLSIDCRLQWRLLILAVKQRNLQAVIKTFIRPWPVPAYLFRQLAQQCFIRTRAYFS